ncbi:hypothetical protein J6590_095531 [Homalodisca vitripennis]|nr:hypothetical protein J6590_095531 [Homalodisca vitripennis]
MCLGDFFDQMFCAKRGSRIEIFYIMVHMEFDLYISSSDTLLGVSPIPKYTGHRVLSLDHQYYHSCNDSGLYLFVIGIIHCLCQQYQKISVLCQLPQSSGECRGHLERYWASANGSQNKHQFLSSVRCRFNQLMATTSYLFFGIIVDLYYAVLSYESRDYIEFIFSFIWALASVSYMVVIVRSVADVTKSAEKTTMIVCKTIHKDIDHAIRTKMERFLLQGTNDRPTFCALHFFKN